MRTPHSGTAPILPFSARLQTIIDVCKCLGFDSAAPFYATTTTLNRIYHLDGEVTITCLRSDHFAERVAASSSNPCGWTWGALIELVAGSLTRMLVCACVSELIRCVSYFAFLLISHYF